MVCCYEGNLLKDMNDYYEENKYLITGKLSTLLGIIGGAGSVLVGLQLFIPASIVIAICEVGIFFTGVGLAKFAEENKNLQKDNANLKNEVRRMTMAVSNYNFPVDSSQDENSQGNITPKPDVKSISPASNVSEPICEPINLNADFATFKKRNTLSYTGEMRAFNDMNPDNTDEIPTIRK